MWGTTSKIFLLALLAVIFVPSLLKLWCSPCCRKLHETPGNTLKLSGKVGEKLWNFIMPYGNPVIPLMHTTRQNGSTDVCSKVTPVKNIYLLTYDVQQYN